MILRPRSRSNNLANSSGTLPIAHGGTGESTANAALNALLPSQASASGKYLKSDGYDASWDALSGADFTVTVDTTPLSGGSANDVLYKSGSVVSSYAPEDTITWYTGLTSLYAQMSTVYAQRTLNSTKAPSGAVTTEVFQYLSTPYSAASFPGYGTLNYTLVDDTYRALDYCNAFALISRNQLRQPVNGTSSTLDIGPEFFYQRKVPNTGNSSYIGFNQYQASTSMVTKTFTTDAIASSSGTSTITVTMPNNFSVGDFVYFPESITVGGLTFGGTSDTYNANSNTYGSYYVQTATSSSFTITVSGTASSSASTGTGKYIRFRAVGTLGSNPFSFTSGLGTVTVTHTGHNLSTGHIVFFAGASAAAGVTINGNHAITVVDANSYTITLSAIQDGAATASSTTTGGGASVTYEATSSNGEVTHVACSMGAQVIDGNANNPYSEWSLGCGSPPNQDGGIARQWYWRRGGFYYTGETPPTDGGIAVRSLSLKSTTSTDLNTVLDTTTAGQNNAIKLKRGGVEKIQIVADSSNLFRIRDVPNTANLLSYNGTTAALTLGAQSDIVIAGAGGVTIATALTLSVAGSLGTPSAITLTNATGLPVSTGISGLGTGVATALATAVTGSGAIGLGIGDAWTAYTPTITAGSGSFTTVSASGRYQTVGKMCHFSVTITDTSNGTAASYINLPLPNSLKPKIDCFFGGINGSTGKGVAGKGYAGSNTVTLFDAGAGTFPIATGQTVTVSGVFETE